MSPDSPWPPRQRSLRPSVLAKGRQILPLNAFGGYVLAWLTVVGINPEKQPSQGYRARL